MAEADEKIETSSVTTERIGRDWSTFTAGTVPTAFAQGVVGDAGDEVEQRTRTRRAAGRGRDPAARICASANS